MSSRIQFLLCFGLRSCLVCGSFQIRHEELCETCREKVLNKIDVHLGEVQFEDIKIPFVSLISWIPAESDHLSRFFFKLKGETPKETWSLLARTLHKEILLKSLMKNFFYQGENTKIIPCPSKSGKADHAVQWAKAIAQEMNGHYFPCLGWTQKPLFKQRHQSRQERWSFATEKHVKFTRDQRPFRELNEQELHSTKFIFADDVITTGSTAMQAYLALGQPKNFMVVTLGHRAFVAKDSSI